MVSQRITSVAAVLVILAATASASRSTGGGMGRELKQATPLPTVVPLPTIPAAGALPPAVTVPLGNTADPFMSAISRMVSFLQTDAANLQANINGAAQGVNDTVSSIPLVKTFETQLAAALQQLQTAISGIVSQGTTLGSTAQGNLNTFLTDLTSQNPITAILQTAMAAVPPAIAGR